MRFGGLIVAIVIAAIAAVVVLRMDAGQAPAPVENGQAPQAQQLKTVNIYVAAQPIAIGATISQEMVAIQPWPEHLVLEGFVRSDDGTSGVVGTVARGPFQQQEPILKSKLANPNDPNFLAGTLPKGMRVITISTNETEGLAGFVFPGDHVDVILTHEVERAKLVKTSSTTKSTTKTGSAVEEKTELSEKPQKEMMTETLLNNVTVLAVDQRASNSGATDKEGRLVIPRSVSLMVSPTDAQRIRLAQSMGTITLSLRALVDRDSADPATVVGKSDVSQHKEDVPSIGAAGSSIKIYRGAQGEGVGQ